MITNGPVNVYQLKYNQEYIAINNLNLLDSFINITKSNGFTNFDL